MNPENHGSGSLPEPSGVTGARILLVEDDSINQQVATELLTSEGFIVDVAEDGEQAVRSINEQTYDIVLMDMQMPLMDGETACRLIRKESRFDRLPILAMTANSMDSDWQRCQAAGMNDLIAKPIDPADLFSRIRKWVSPKYRRFSERRPQVKDAAGIPRETGTTAELDNVEGLEVDIAVERLMGKRSLYESLIRKFAYGPMSDAATTVAEQVADGRMADAERTSHSLKGVAGTVGASELRARAAGLEKAVRERLSDMDVETARQGVAEELARLVSSIRAVVVAPVSASDSDRRDAAADLRTLSPDLVEAMRCAVEFGDVEAIEEHARTLSGDHPGLARTLIAACQVCDLDGLTRLLGR